MNPEELVESITLSGEDASVIAEKYLNLSRDSAENLSLCIESACDHEAYDILRVFISKHKPTSNILREMMSAASRKKNTEILKIFDEFFPRCYSHCEIYDSLISAVSCDNLEFIGHVLSKIYDSRRICIKTAVALEKDVSFHFLIDKIYGVRCPIDLWQELYSNFFDASKYFLNKIKKNFITFAKKHRMLDNVIYNAFHRASHNFLLVFRNEFQEYISSNQQLFFREEEIKKAEIIVALAHKDIDFNNINCNQKNLLKKISPRVAKNRFGIPTEAAEFFAAVIFLCDELIEIA